MTPYTVVRVNTWKWRVMQGSALILDNIDSATLANTAAAALNKAQGAGGAVDVAAIKREADVAGYQRGLAENNAQDAAREAAAYQRGLTENNAQDTAREEAAHKAGYLAGSLARDPAPAPISATVSNMDELKLQLGLAVATGRAATIHLAPGDYGRVDFNIQAKGPIFLMSKDPHNMARFEAIHQGVCKNFYIYDVLTKHMDILQTDRPNPANPYYIVTRSKNVGLDYGVTTIKTTGDAAQVAPHEH
jgi:hypothetical protein